MLKLYAIKHLPTGHFLPAPFGRGGRGGSHVEPVEVDEIALPRLFHTEHAAKVALSHWLKGAVTVSRRGGYDSYSGEYWDDEDWHIEPQPHRKREEMAVVEVTLCLS